MNNASKEGSQEPKSDSRKLWYGILTVLLLCTWGYIIYDKSKVKESLVQKDNQILTVSTEKDSIQAAFTLAQTKLDSLTSNNTALQGTLASKTDEINKLKANISATLRKDHASNEELAKAKEQIAELNQKIDSFSAEIDKLKGENKQLTTANASLSSIKDSLVTTNQTLQQHLSTTEEAKKNVEDIASTLHASNISIIPITKKGSGKEKETTTAKRVALLRFTFDLDENRLATTGIKEVYISVTGPDGKVISSGDNYKTRDSGMIAYTNKVEVNYDTEKKTPVSFDWKKDDGKYQIGNYKIVIYHNGFKIGEGLTTLKKGGLFS